MPGENEVGSAWRAILDTGIVGAFLVLTLAALIWSIRRVIAMQTAIDVLNEKRLDDHKTFFAAQAEATREALMSTQRTLDGNTEHMKAMTETFLRSGRRET